MQGYCDVYKWTILKRTSPEVKCLHPTSSKREMCTSSVSSVIYHNFSHGAISYKFNGENVNVMLEFVFNRSYASFFNPISIDSSFAVFIRGLARRTQDPTTYCRLQLELIFYCIFLVFA